MRTTIAILLCALMPVSVLVSQDLDEILENYFETTGQEEFNNVNSLKMKGKSIAQGMETDFVMYQLRPDKMKLEVDIQGAKMIQAYDGETGWFVAPWLGTTEPQILSGRELKSLQNEADFEGPLYNWKEKGHKVKLIGKSDVEGTKVYEIELTKGTGDVFIYYIDAENYVLLKMRSLIDTGEKAIESDIYFGNYDYVEDVLFPFNMETKVDGDMVSSVSIEEVEFNAEIDPETFSLPGSEKKE